MDEVELAGIEPPSCATRGRLTASHISYHACQEVRQETRPKTPSARPLASGPPPPPQRAGGPPAKVELSNIYIYGVFLSLHTSRNDRYS